jgi:hypothetical protein
LRLDREAILVLLGKLARGLDHLVDQRGELHRLRSELKFPGFDLRQIECLIDEVNAPLGAFFLQRWPRRSDPLSRRHIRLSRAGG